MSLLKLGVWPQLLVDRCETIGCEPPQARPSQARVDALRQRAWEIERTISPSRSSDLEGDALIWLVSKYAVQAGGRSFTAAWAELADQIWGPEPETPAQPSNAAAPSMAAEPAPTPEGDH